MKNKPFYAATWLLLVLAFALILWMDYAGMHTGPFIRLLVVVPALICAIVSWGRGEGKTPNSGVRAMLARWGVSFGRAISE